MRLPCHLSAIQILGFVLIKECQKYSCWIYYTPISSYHQPHNNSETKDSQWQKKLKLWSLIHALQIGTWVLKFGRNLLPLSSYACDVVLPNHWYPCNKWQDVTSPKAIILIFLTDVVSFPWSCCVSSCVVAIKSPQAGLVFAKFFSLLVALCYDSDVMLPAHHNFRHVSWQLLSTEESDSDPEHGTWRCPDVVARIGYCWCMLQSYKSEHWQDDLEETTVLCYVILNDRISE